MTLEVTIDGFAEGGFAFGCTDVGIADAMRDAVADGWDCEIPPDDTILQLRMSMDEARELVRWMSEYFPTCCGTTLKRKATMFPHPAGGTTRH